MKKKNIYILCVTVFLLIPISAISSEVSMNQNEYIYIQLDGEEISPRTTLGILRDLEDTQQKHLIVDTQINDINVKYWEHHINDIVVKNDYVLLHFNVKTKEIVKYQKKWTNLSSLTIPDQLVSNPDTYYWKQIVVFPQEYDVASFYTFDIALEFPVICWEVRHTDGSTILYDDTGNRIGCGIPSPHKGYSLSGYNDDTWPDPWVEFRENADYWFSSWCDTTSSVSLPTPSSISAHIRDESVMYFYELAHGDEYQFQADQIGSYYTATILQTDMVNRQPMEFAFLGSCHGMTGTDQGTFSYEFRKGQMVNTVTVGFDHMENCPGWEFGYQWQDSLFENMSKGVPIKEAFDVATAQYPTIAPAVVFLGDHSLAVPSPPSKPSRPNGPLNGKTEQLYSYATSSIDPNNDDIYYWFDWGDNTNTGWIGPYDSAQIVNASHAWINEGSFSIKVKAKDKNGMESPWSDPLSVSMPKSKMSRIPVMRFLERDLRLLHMLLSILGKVL